MGRHRQAVETYLETAEGDPVTVEVSVPYDGQVELIGFFLIPVPASLEATVSMAKEGP